MRAVEIDEVHLVVEWQVFHICLELLPLTTVKYRDCKGTNFSLQICFRANSAITV